MKIKKTILVTEEGKGLRGQWANGWPRWQEGVRSCLLHWAHRTATLAIAQETVGLWASRNTMGILTSRHFVSIWKGTS